MKKHLLFKSLLLLCALVVGSGSVWATKVTFTAGTDTGSSSVTKSGITITMSTMNESVYKCYKSSSMTVSSTVGKITEVKITCSANGTEKYGPGCFVIPSPGGVGSYTYESDGPTGTWTGEHDALSLYASTNQVRMSTIEVTYTSSGPSISANNVDIAYYTTAGSISYTINNPVTGGELTAALTAASDWLTVGAVSASAVAFTTDANTSSERSATIRLTYTYDTSKTVTKDVTVTQAEYVEPAVFAPFYESFDTNDGLAGWSGSAAAKTFKSDNTWVASNSYGGYMCARFGGSSKLGVATTPALKLDPAKTYVLTFNAGAWNGDATNLKLSSDDAIFSGSKSTNVTMENNAWKGYYIVLTGGNASTTITFQGNAASKSRFFLDEVRVMEKSAFEALTASKTVESYGWATYIPDYAVEFESGDAYIVTAILNTDLTLEGVTKVPAKTPVLLKGVGDKTITVISDASVDAPTSISLLTIGNGKALESGYYPYVLAKNGTGACFKQWTGDMSALNGRVMLVLDQAAAARGIFELDDATGISEVETIKQNHEGYYNLAGQRVANPTKGLYIVNGKKVIIK
jgi:hypothetical protein